MSYGFVKMKSHKRADCSVVAAHMALGLASYDAAEALLASAGRKPGRRVPSRIFTKLGMVSRPDLSCQTVASAMDRMQEGRFIVFVSGHFFAVVDGRIFDSLFTPSGAHVKMVYEAPMDCPAFLDRYPFLKNLVRLAALPDVRSILERRMDLRPTNVRI